LLSVAVVLEVTVATVQTATIHLLDRLLQMAEVLAQDQIALRAIPEVRVAAGQEMDQVAQAIRLPHLLHKETTVVRAQVLLK
jgi:hypothetical protein